MQENQSRGPAGKFVIALLAPFAVASLMQLTWPFFQPTPTSLFVLAVMFSAWYGGLGPGLLSLLVSFLLSDYFFIEPYFALWPPATGNLVRLGTLVSVGSVISVLSELTHRTRRRAEHSFQSAQRADETRRLVEERYHTLFDQAPDGILIADPQSIYLDANASMCRMLGYAREELIGLHASDIVIQSEVEHIGVALTVIKAKSDYHREWRFRRKDGSVFDGEVIATTMPDGNLLGLVRDITARMRAEEKLRLSEEDRRRFFELSQDVLCILGFDGYFMDVNPAWEKTLGYTKAELLSIPFIEFIHPDDRQATLAEAEQVSAGKELIAFENRYRCKDGSYRRFQWSVTPVVEDRVMYGVARDITEQKQAEEALRESEHRLRFTLESCNIGAWDLDLVDHTAYRSVEHDRIFGYAEMLPQWTLEDFLHHALPEYRAEVEALVRDATAASRGWTYECPIRRVDGEIRWVWFSGSYRTDHAGHSRVGGIVMDITERKQAEEARRASEARYRTLFEYAPNGIVIADMAGRYLDANPAICRMLGYSREEMVARSVADVVVPGEISHIGPAFAEVDAGTDHHREWQFKRKDDSVFAAEVIAVQVPNGLVMGMVRDITERKRIEARMRRLVDSNVQGVMFWNRKGEIFNANSAFLHIVGYTQEDMEAGRIDWTTMTPSEYADLDRHSLEEIAATGVCTPIEKEYIRKDGSRVPVTIGAANFEDSPDEGVSFVLDITERRRTEQALRDSEEHFRFLNNLSEATRTLADPDQIMAVMARMLGEHLHASRCAYADVAQDGEQFTILHDYTDGCASTVGNYQLSLFGARAVATLHNGQTLIIRNVEEELLPGDGADMFNAIGIKAIITCPLVKDGGLRAMMAVHQTTPRNWKPSEIAIVQDVVERCWATIERRTAEEQIHQLNADLEQRVTERTAQLEAANKELEAFSYSVSHDLRAPLRGVDGYVRMLKEDCADQLDAEANRLLDVVSNEAKRMGQLIDDLLKFSRLGREQMDSQVIDMTALASDVFKTLNRTAQQSAVRFELNALPTTQGDLSMLRQVFVNLIGNAGKFTRHQSTPVIEVGGASANGETTYYVKDNGVGFDEKYGHKLFGVFERLHTEAEFEGTGVGLALVQRVIHRHGGKVWAEGTPNQGATFYFTLPIRKGWANG